MNNAHVHICVKYWLGLIYQWSAVNGVKESPLSGYTCNCLHRVSVSIEYSPLAGSGPMGLTPYLLSANNTATTTNTQVTHFKYNKHHEGMINGTAIH